MDFSSSIWDLMSQTHSRGGNAFQRGFAIGEQVGQKNYYEFLESHTTPLDKLSKDAIRDIAQNFKVRNYSTMSQSDLKRELEARGVLGLQRRIKQSDVDLMSLPTSDVKIFARKRGAKDYWKTNNKEDIVFNVIQGFSKMKTEDMRKLPMMVDLKTPSELKKMNRKALIDFFKSKAKIIAGSAFVPFQGETYGGRRFEVMDDETRERLVKIRRNYNILRTIYPPKKAFESMNPADQEFIKEWDLEEDFYDGEEEEEEEKPKADKPKKETTWQQAIKIYYDDKGERVKIPRKGTEEYDEIKKIQADLEKDKPVKIKEPLTTWNEANKIYAERHGVKIKMYKKGTPEYEEIKKIQADLIKNRIIASKKPKAPEPPKEKPKEPEKPKETPKEPEKHKEQKKSEYEAPKFKKSDKILFEKDKNEVEYLKKRLFKDDDEKEEPKKKKKKDTKKEPKKARKESKWVQASKVYAKKHNKPYKIYKRSSPEWLEIQAIKDKL